jgi:hypothetical protein
MACYRDSFTFSLHVVTSQQIAVSQSDVHCIVVYSQFFLPLFVSLCLRFYVHILHFLLCSYVPLWGNSRCCQYLYCIALDVRMTAMVLL